MCLPWPGGGVSTNLLRTVDCSELLSITKNSKWDLALV